ncbi:DUF4328 domain-containing protein [Lentzea sp. NPDC005914]|uniref:DUF4328 domain-containing protein n=1 Tax=Lentzea sp. NPDC005914 TaxID=3154572 RepID=UPI0033CA3567
MEKFRPVRSLGIAASVLAGLTALGNVGEAAADWFNYTAIRGYRDGTATASDLDTADKVNVVVGTPAFLLTLAAGVVFVVWLYNARVNAERLTPAAEHRRSRTWVWLGWFVPFVNLWYPKQVVDDVWRASDPQQQGVPLQQRVQHKLVTQWWIAFVLMWIMDRAYLHSYRNGMLTTDSFLTTAIFSTLSAIAGVVAAVLVVQVVKRISDFQSSPLPVQSSSD